MTKNIYTKLETLVKNDTTLYSVQAQASTNSIELYNALNKQLNSYIGNSVSHKIKGNEYAVPVADLLNYAKKHNIGFAVKLDTKQKETTNGYRWQFTSELVNSKECSIVLSMFVNDLQEQNELATAIVSSSIQWLNYLYHLVTIDNYSTPCLDYSRDGRYLNKKFSETANKFGYNTKEKENTIVLGEQGTKKVFETVGDIYELVQIVDHENNKVQKEKALWGYYCDTCKSFHLVGINIHDQKIACPSCAENGTITILKCEKLDDEKKEQYLETKGE